MDSIVSLVENELQCPYPLVAIVRSRKLAVLLFRLDESAFERACPLVMCALKPYYSLTFRHNDKVCVVSVVEYSKEVEELVRKISGIQGVEVKVLRDKLSDEGIAVCNEVFPLVFGNKRLIVFMTEEFIEGLFKLKSRVGPAVDAIMYHVGYCYGLSVGKYLLEELNVKSMLLPVMRKREAVELFAKLATAAGWGRFKFEKIDPVKLHAVVSAEDCWEAKAYSRLKGRSNAPVCRLTAGVIAGCAAAFLKKDTQCIERECAAMGAKRCVFEVRTI